MNDLPALLGRVVAILERAGVPFMIAGSFASSTHGAPRSTQDLDIVIDPTAASLESVLSDLPAEEYYVDADVARDALQRRTMFNIIDLSSGWKIDFVIRKDRAFSVEELQRRQPVEMLGVAVFVATAEDTIIAKLEWSKLAGGSERQRSDVAGILATHAVLDLPYLERWVRELDLEDEWQIVRRA
jgi:hypothetical protein